MSQINVKISVRNLIEFIYRHGDIDDRFGSINAAHEGIRIHKMLQNDIKEESEKHVNQIFISEKFLSRNFKYEDISLTLEGRADGVLFTYRKHLVDSTSIKDNIGLDKDINCSVLKEPKYNNTLKLEEEKNIKVIEIKTTVMDMLELDEHENILHWAQCKLYCYMICLEENISEIDLDLVYYHRKTFHTKTFSKHFKLQELENFFKEIIDKYGRWILLQDRWLLLRNNSIEKLEFPFDNYRKGQRELAVNVYRTIKERKDIYIEAPTGIGKTISTLFPTVKALNIYPEAKVIYLTAKNIIQNVVEESLELLRKKGLRIKTLTLTAKDKICFLEERSCNSDDCIYAKGHFDRVNDAILEILENHEALTQNIIEIYSKKYGVCPFELSLDLIQWCDLVICDYNYFFDPKIMIRRMEFDDSSYIFLVDEAHNLVERARDMYSATINIEVMKNAKKELKYKDKKIVGILNNIIKYIKEIMFEEDRDTVLIEEGPSEIISLLKKFVSESERYLKDKNNNDIDEAFMEAYFNCLDFIRVGELFSREFVYYGEKKGNDYILKIFCVNPSNMIHNCIKKNLSTVFFSATLSPLGYFKKLLGGEDSYSMKLKSPFPPENRKLIIKTDVDTRYKYRNHSYEKIADYINEVLEKNEGNFLVFFSSFEFMNKVYEIYNEKYNCSEIFIQEASMTEEERLEFLYRFEGNYRVIGFVVLGGVFSEGIDLWGDRLKGAIIVGVGLPKVSFERKLIEDYFNNQNEPGFHYAYTFPGMNKVIQAMGRVIRRENDVGTIVLIDKRYDTETYKSIIY